MADEDVFSLIIDVQSKGVRATERELVAATEALNSLQLGTDVTSESFETLSKAFSMALKEVRTFLGDTRHFIAAEKQLARETDAAVKALQGLDSQFSKADRSIASATKTLENFHAEQRRNSAVFNAEGDRTAAWDEEFRALERVTDAQREFAEAVQASSSRNEQARRADVVRDRELQAAATYQAAQAEREFAEAVQASFARNEQARRQDAVRDRELQAAAIQRATEAEMQAANATQNFAGNLPRLRYALYDVSSALTMAGVAMTALGVATFGTSIKMDRAFADVLRTTETFGAAGNAASKLRQEFETLFTSMPVSWSDLTEIGTLAGQLNIARDSVAEFTELVAMFAATTDVSVEQAATAFGRLSQLLDVPASELQNLGSSILAVGVNSIATESQIIAISSQITSMAATAGFTADQVFGLSAALASLGTQPELSRGVVVRLFTNITRAIDQGGERLNAFGRVAGTTGAEFARAWGDDAAGALLSLMQGLGAVEQTKAVATLNELGIVAARDVPTILRLAQNSEVLAESLQVAAQGYADGSALGEQYNIIASTVAEKLNVLVNNFQNLIATIGQSSGMLGGLVDVAIGLVKVLTALADNPVASTFLGIAVAGIAVVGIVSLLSGVALRGVASVLAMATAWTEFNVVGVSSVATMRTMVSSLFGITTSSATAATAVRGLSVAMRLIPGIGLALTALSAGWAIFEDATKSAQERAAAFFGDVSGFQEAIAKDTAIWRETGQAIGTFEAAVESAESSTDNAVEATKIWLGTQKEVPPAVDDATGAITKQTQALGENAEAWLRDALLKSDAKDKIIELANDPALLQAAESIGLNISELIQAGFSKPGQNGAAEYVKGLLNEIDVSGALDEQYGGSFRASTIYLDIAVAVDNLLTSVHELGVANRFLSGTSDEAAERLRELNEAALESYSDFIDLTKATLDLEGSIHDLGASLAENGNSFDEFTEAGRNNISALLKTMDALAAQTPGDAEATAAAFRGLYDFLVKGANVSASSLTVLANAIKELGGASTQVTAFNPDSFFEGWSKNVTKAGSATSSAAKKMRTLVDYARDLRSTFSRAFDLRFGVSSTADKITSSFINIRNASEEAARNIRSLQADILGLTSDISIQEYFLSVAVAYGDTERAAAIEANLAKLRADLDDKTAALAKEEAKHSKTLVGNSEAAIENRAEMEALVQQYQEHLEALAASGMSQADLAKKAKELRDQFLQQAVALGYNAAELAAYTVVFDDMAKIIAKVPRKVNVDVSAAGLDPATQAIREFEAALKTAQTSASKGITLGKIVNPNTDKEIRRLALQAQIVANESILKNLIAQKRYTDAGYTAMGLQGLREKLRLGTYAEGGFTGRGGKYEPAGIVHRGEYVVPKHLVNQSTGLPYADAMGKLQKGASGTGYARGGFVSGGSLAPNGHIASFGPMAQQQLQHALQQIVTLDGKTISNSSAQQYADQTTVGAY